MMSNEDPNFGDRFGAENLRSFLRPDDTPVSAVLTLRPFSSGMMACLRQIRSPFLEIDAEGNLPAMLNPEYESLAAVYVMSAPLPEVRRMIFQEQLFREAVLAFGDTLSVADLAAALGKLGPIIAAGTVGLVDVVPKPELPGRPGEQPPPN